MARHFKPPSGEQERRGAWFWGPDVLTPLPSSGSSAEALTPSRTVFGGGAFGREFGLDEVTREEPHDGLACLKTEGEGRGGGGGEGRGEGRGGGGGEEEKEKNQTPACDHLQERPSEDTARRKTGFTQHSTCGRLDLERPSLLSCEKEMAVV